MMVVIIIQGELTHHSTHIYDLKTIKFLLFGGEKKSKAMILIVVRAFGKRQVHLCIDLYNMSFYVYIIHPCNV